MATKKKCSPPWHCDGCGKARHRKSNPKCRCKLIPYNKKCPKEAPRRGRPTTVPVNKHHVIPDAWWRGADPECAPSKNEGLCLCVRGKGKTAEHGNIHDSIKDKTKDLPAKISFDEAAEIAAQSAVEGMGRPKCDVQDIKDQLEAHRCGPLDTSRKKSKKKKKKSKHRVRGRR